MRIIIAGIGDVGFHLAKLMSSQSHDITIIDENTERLAYASNHLDIFSIKGSATSVDILKEARVKETDLFLAVTNLDEVNLIASMVAKKLGAKHCVSRISNDEYNTKAQKKFYKELGIDNMIFPEDIAAKEIFRLAAKAEFSEYFDFHEKKLSVAALQIHEGSPLDGITIEKARHLNPKNDFIPIAILRDGETIIPRKETSLAKGDLIYFVMEEKSIHKVLRLTGSEHFDIKNIMIVGGGKVGSAAAALLERNYNVKLVEKDKNKCFALSEKLKNTLIINADGRDVDILEDEDLENMDAFIALTGDAETNIITSIVAKKHGVRKTIALVDNVDYINISQSIGIDALINKKLIAANNIFRYIRRGEIADLVSLPGLKAEILEFVVSTNCKINNLKVKDLGFPKDAIIAGVIRDGKGFVTMGDFQIQNLDHVIVVALPSAIDDVETFFCN